MNLCISSFDNSFVKTLVLSSVIFILYSLILHKLNPQVMMFQNQWIGNYSIAESFIYQKNPVKTVIVGSSMSARLNNKKLGQDIYNLSFSGGSALTGLHIIMESTIVPEVIFIEINILERPLNQDMLHNLFVPVIWKIKRYILSLQYTYQPINIVLTFIKSKFGRNEEEKINEKKNNEKLKFGINQQLKNESNIDIIETSRFVEQKKLIDYFTSLGVKIVFFQMPVHKDILLSEGYKKRKSVLVEKFSGLEFKWMENNHKYETVDGIHLTFKSALEYSFILKDIIDNN